MVTFHQSWLGLFQTFTEDRDNWKHPCLKLMVTLISLRGRGIPDIHRGTVATGNTPTPS